MIEAFTLVLLRQRLPIEFSCLHQRQRSHHVSAGKGERVLNASVYMAFGSQMDDTVNVFLLHQFIESVEVADVHPHELVVGLIFHIFQVSQVSGICQLIQVDNVVLQIFVYE